MTRVDRRSLGLAVSGGLLKALPAVLGLAIAVPALATTPNTSTDATATDVIATADAAGDQAAQPENTAENQGQLGEVVVTATRRSEQLEKVPISVQAITNAQLEVAGVRSFTDVVRLTPALQVTTSGLTGNVAIRGISSNAGQPTTGVYIDDTPIQPVSGSGTVFPTVFDLERVEVLRGPQGTLFGSGSEGGAVRFIQAQPSLTQYTGYARAEGATTEGHAASYELGMAYGGPIVDNLIGFRVSAYYRQDGGYIDTGPTQSFAVNHTNGAGFAAAATIVPDEASLRQNVNWTDTRAFHAALRFQPFDSLTITPSIFYQRQDSGRPSSSFYLSASNPSQGKFWSPTFTPAPAGTILCSGPTCVDPGPLTQMTLPTGLYTNTTLNVLAFNIAWNIGKAASLISTTSYVHREEVDNSDTTTYYSVSSINSNLQPWPLPGQFSPTFDEDPSRAFTQELRLSGETKYLNWLVGGYFSKNNQPDFELEQNNVWGGATYFFKQHVPSPGPPFGPGYSSYDDYWGMPLIPGSGTYYGLRERWDKQLAGFAQLDFKWSVFTLTAGIRATADQQTYEITALGAENNENNPAGQKCPAAYTIPGSIYCPYGTGYFAPEIAQGAVNASARPVTPKYALNAQITPNNLLYVSATKGFRIGGAQLPKPSDCGVDLTALGYVDANGKPYTPLTYAPDYVWSYEVGSKNTMMDNKLALNASVYKIRWSDIQTSVSLSTCGYGLTVNTGSATVKGFDLETQYTPIYGLQLRANVAYTDATLDDGLYQPSGAAVEARGSAIPGSGAPWNVVGSGRYEFPLKADLQGYFYLDDAWNSQWRRTGRNDPRVYNVLPFTVLVPNPAYNQLNLRLGVIRGALDVSFFMNNVLDARPLFMSENSNLKYLWTATTIRPRTFGLTASFRF